MSEQEWIEIPASKYHQHLNVWLLFQGNLIPTRVLRRRYDPDDGAWYYQLDGMGLWFIEDDLGPQADNIIG